MIQQPLPDTPVCQVVSPQSAGSTEKLSHDKIDNERDFSEALTQLGLFFVIVMRVNPFSHVKMRRPCQGNTALNVVLLLYLLGFLGE